MRAISMSVIIAWSRRYKTRLMLAARLVIAALLTFALGHLLGLAQTYWAVLTAVIVMQASVGGALKAVIDRLAGSVGGAVWGVIITLTFPHRDPATLALALVLAVAPLAVATAFNPGWRIAPVTAIILLLTPGSQAAGPVAAAMSRVAEVVIGSLVAVAVALTLGRSEGVSSLASAAAKALTAMSELIAAIMADLGHATAPASLDPINARIRAANAEAEAAAGEIRRERLVALAGAFDPAPLCRTLRRLHHDLIMLSRASAEALPAPALQHLQPPGQAMARALSAYFEATAQAIVGRGAAPDLAPTRQAIGMVLQAVAVLRTSGLTRGLADETLARVFGLAFAVEQLGGNLSDLAQRAQERP
jgi:uncharacterized membrane protein YccC